MRSVAANGLNFAVDEAGDGNAVALCLHGFPESRFSWRYQLPILAARGWRAVAPDLRGYGDTSRPKGRAAYALDHLVDDVAALFEALGADRRILIAHDWGALIAWVYAMRYPGKLDALVVMNVPHPAVFTRVLKTSKAQRKRSRYAAFFQLPLVPELLLSADRARRIGEAFTTMAVDKTAFPPTVTDVYRDNAAVPGALTAMLAYYRVNWGAISTEPVVPIATPTLMIWGEEDTALGLELTEGYSGLVDDFTLVRLPGVSHWVQQEAPDTVNATLTRWLETKAIAAR